MDVINSNTLINIQGVEKEYGGKTVLHNITFDIVSGHIVGIIGPNGAGKSTLANIILGFDSKYIGLVKIPSSIRIAYVPQFSNADIYALPLSVYEFLRSVANTYYGLTQTADKEAVIKTLKHVGLDKHYLTHNIYALSGGERQRVLIARALLGDPDFIVFDEPLASVDYSSRGELYGLLRHLNKKHGTTMVLISHDVESILSICDDVLHLNKTLHHELNPKQLKTDKIKDDAVAYKCQT